MSATKKYLNPPLVEAVFELFYNTSDWTAVIPGMFYNEIKDKYPKISQSQGGFGFSLDNKGIKIGGGGSELTQYRNETGNSIIQLSGSLLTVNKLPEYESWDSYLEAIKYGINALSKVIKINKVNRIGIKAINKVDIEKCTYENFKKHFTIYPLIPKNITNELNSIQLNVESPVIEQEEVLAISLSTLRKEPNYESPTMFQLYVLRTKEIEIGKIEKWLGKSHSILTETFENSLTKYCKEKFNNV